MKTRIIQLFSLTISLVFFQQTGHSQCNGTFTVNAGPDVSRCPGSPGVTLGATPTVTGGTTPYTYNWTPAAGLSCTNCANPVATNTSTTTYTVTVSDLNNVCTGTDDVTVTVGANAPATGFNFFPTTPACANVPVQFTNTSTPGLTYAWNFGDPASGASNTSTAINPTHVFTATGSTTQDFTVTLTVTSASGCQTTVTHTVTVKQTPAFSLSDPYDFKNCGGSDFNLTATELFTSTNISNYQIQWGDGTPNFNASSFPAGGITHTYTTQEIFDLLYIVTGTNGCIDSLAKIVTNITNPAIGAANPGGTNGCGPLEICFPLNNYSLNHSSTTYRVEFGDGATMILPHPPPAVICHTYSQSSCPFPGGAFTFKITARNQCDSSQATITPIRIYKAPTAGFTNPNPVCTGSSVPFTNTTVTGYFGSCSSNATYSWDFGDGTATSSSVSPSHVYSAPGTYTVTLTAGNPQCGFTTASHSICVENPPVNSYTISQNSGCIPFTTQVTNNSTTLNTCAVGRTWTVLFNGNSCTSGTGTFSFVGGTNANSINPQFQFSSPGVYTIRQTLTNSCGTFTSDKTVTAQSVPIITMNNLSTICAGQSVNPYASVNTCYSAADSYSWSMPNGSPSTSSSLNPGSVTYASGGSNTVTLQATNQCGTSSASKSFTVTPLPPGLNPQVNGPLCAGSTAYFSATYVPGATYHWSGPGLSSSTAQNPTINVTNVGHSTTYSVYATVGNCSGPVQTVTLVVNPLPTVNAGPDFSICRNSTMTLTGSPAGGTWSGIGITPAGVFTPTTSATSVNLTYTYTTPEGCSRSDIRVATINPLPTSNAGIDRTLCNQPIATTLTGSPTGGSWSGAGITNSSGQFTPFANGTFPVVYTVTNVYGCIARDTMVVTVINPTSGNAGPDITLCANAANVQLTGSPTGGTWSGPGITSAGLFDPTVGGTFNMIYNLGTGSCLTKDTMRFIVNPLPIVDAGPNFAICNDAGPSTRVGTPSGGTWTGTGVTPGGVFDPAVSGVGSFVLTYTYTDTVTGCSTFDNATATVNAKPVVNAGPDLTLCNQPIAVTLTGTPAGGTWTGTGVTNPSGQYTPSAVGVFPVVYTATTANGCFNSDTILVTVGTPSYSNAGPDSTVCIDAANVQLTGIPNTGTWTGTGVTAAGIFDPTVAGTFNMVYSVGGGTCITRDTLKMIVNPLPVVNAGTDFNICINAPTLNLVGIPSGGTWSGNGVNAAGSFNPAVGAGAQSLTYTYIDPVTHCQNTDIVVANVRPLPVPNFNYSPVVCGNVQTSFVNTTTPSAGTSYVWDFGDGSTTAAVSPNHTYTAVGFLNVQLIATTSFGCIDSITKPIEVREPPMADFTISQDSACAPVLVDFTNSSSGISISYNWNFGNGQTSTLQNPPTVTYVQGIEDTSYTVVLTVTNACGTATHSETIIAMPKPVSIFGTNFDFGCSPFAVEIVDNSVGLPDTYEWDFGDGTTSTDPSLLLTHVFTTGLHDTTYTITLIVTNECGADTSDYEIMVLPNQVHAFFNTNITAGCVPLTVEFTDFSTGGNVHTWDFGDQNSSTALSPTHTFTTAGTYTVYSYVNDGCGYDTASVQITVYPSPVVNFTSMPDSVCINELFTFTNLSANLASSAWDFGDGQTSGFTHPTHAYAASGTYQVTLVGASINNLCTSTITKPVVVAINPVAAFTPSTTSGCAPLQVSFNNNSTHSSFQTWSYGDGNTSSLLSPPHTFTSPGTYTVKLVVENSNGCSDSISQVITVYPVPASNFTFTTTNPCYSPATLTTSNTSTGGTDYAWNFGNGQTSTLTSPTATYAAPGTYTVKLTTSNSYGCSSIHTESVTIYPTPVATLSVTDDTLCLGDAVTVSSQSSFSNSIKWIMGDGNQYTSNPVTHTYASAGTYTVSLIAYGTGGCSDTTTTTIGVYPIPVADFDYTLTDPCYSPATLTTINTSTGGTNYAWNFGNGTTSVLASPIGTYPAAGTFNIQLTTSTIYGCSSSHTESVTIFPTPAATFTMSEDTLCLGETVTFTSQSTLTNSITWDLGDGTQVTSNPVTHTYAAAGVYTVSLIAYGAGGCSDTMTKLIGVYPVPVADFNINTSNVCYAPVNLTTTNMSTGGNSYAWNFGNGQTSTQTNPTSVYNTPGTYNVQLTTATIYGCSDTHTESFTVYPTPIAAFTISEDTICLGETVTLSSQSQFANSLTWIMGDGVELTGNPISYEYGAEGIYNISVIANGAGGCSDTMSMYPGIVVNPTPTAGFDYINVEDPLSGTIQFTNTSTNATYYTWTFGNGNTSHELNPTEKYSGYGDYIVLLEAYNQFGCSDTVEQLVVVDFFSGLFVPNAIYPGHPSAGVSGFLPKGVGLAKYELLIYDDWGNLIWQSTALDSDGRPTEAWKGTYNGEPVQQDAYVWKITATFLDTKTWRGKEYSGGKFRKSGTVTVIR